MYDHHFKPQTPPKKGHIAKLWLTGISVKQGQCLKDSFLDCTCWGEVIQQPVEEHEKVLLMLFESCGGSRLSIIISVWSTKEIK